VNILYTILNTCYKIFLKFLSTFFIDQIKELDSPNTLVDP